MSLIIQQESSTFQQVPVGQHIAVCYQMIDLGTQEVEYKGETKHQKKVIIGWELSNELMESGQPFVINRTYTASMNDKSNLHKDLMNWRGRKFTTTELESFDLTTIIGKACMLSCIESENGKYVNVNNVTGLPKGTKSPKLVNKEIILSLDPLQFDQDVFDSLGDYYKEKIKLSPEYAKAVDNESKGNPIKSDDGSVSTEDSEIPF